MAQLDNSERTLLKATHTPVKVSREGMAVLGRALDKVAFVRAVKLADGELAMLRRQAGDEVSEDTWKALARFEPSAARSGPGEFGVLATVPAAELSVFGDLLARLREAEVAAPPASTSAPPAGEERDAPARLSILAMPLIRRDVEFRETESLAYLARVAAVTFKRSLATTPVGMLHLERIEMTPVGIERGELVATIPLAPGETTAVEQKEWSVTEEDLSTIVTDYLEEYTERGVTEKSELAQAATSESKRNQQLGLSASLSGSYGFVTFAASTTFSSTLEVANSLKESRSQAREVTAKASSRVRRERKITIQAKTVTGFQETTTRQIANASPTAGMRIDYFSMMRKWRVRLLQYGLRQTYDVAIPSPGEILRKPFREIDELTAQIEAPFVFQVKIEQVTRESYRRLATDYGAAVSAPPVETLSTRLGGPLSGLDGNRGWHFRSVDVDVPENYEVQEVWLDAMLGNVNNDQPQGRVFVIFGYGWPKRNSAGALLPQNISALVENGRASFVENLTRESGFMRGARGRQSIQVFLHYIPDASVTFPITYKLTDEAERSWQFAVWQTLRDRAAENHAAFVKSLVARRDVLVRSISAGDTLTLRREEREEIMRSVLEWLFGPQSEPGQLLREGRTPQETIKFVQQAFEWENLLYFIYPYFWVGPMEREFVRTLKHPDPERQHFLRAGSARVVLTVRPGYEALLAEFIDYGTLTGGLPEGHPYLTIGREIAAYAQTNYPGIPPANPAVDFRPLLSPLQREAWSRMVTIMAQLEQWQLDHGDRFPTTQQGLSVLTGPVPATDPWGHPYVYVSPGRFTEYELSSPGEDGISGPNEDGIDDDITSWAPASLIGEWFEYTPSRGTDIAVNSVLTDLA